MALTDPADRARVTEALGRRLAERPELLFACLHGSFTTGGPSRDIDVAVWIDPASRPDGGWLGPALDLSVELTLALGETVDVQVLNQAPLAFRFHALNGEPLLVRDWERFHELRARTWDDYFDFRPFARQYLREVLGA